MKKYVENIRHLPKNLWRREVLNVAIIFVVFMLIFAFIGTIPELSADIEHDTANLASTLGDIISNPINAPYKLFAYITTTISPTILGVRFSSYIFYILTCIAFYYVLRHWHTVQVATLTTLIFAANSVVLATSRLGAEWITVFTLFMFSALLLWQLHSKSNKFVPIIVLISLAGLLYTPGALWFFVVLGISFFNRFKTLFINIKHKTLFIGSLISLLAITPLIVGFVNNPESLISWLLLPQTIVLSEIPKSILQVPSAYIYRMPIEPLVNVGRLPIFDLASGILFLIGLNAYRKKFKLDRTKVMIGIAVVGLIVGALGQVTTAAILLLPFMFSIIAAGIEYLLDQWGGVFPKNPFAKSFGLLLVVMVVLFSVYYQLTRFLVVWPQTPETREIYNKSRIIN